MLMIFFLYLAPHPKQASDVLQNPARHLNQAADITPVPSPSPQSDCRYLACTRPLTPIRLLISRQDPVPHPNQAADILPVPSRLLMSLNI